MNIVLLRGTLSSDPVIRVLPSEQRICSLEVTTRTDDGPASSAPASDPRPVAPPQAQTPVDPIATLIATSQKHFETGERELKLGHLDRARTKRGRDQFVDDERVLGRDDVVTGIEKRMAKEL